ncbi:MAG: trigger factor [Actinomycetes bacterium]
MKSSVEHLSPTRVKLTIEVPFEELAEALAAAYKRISSQVNIPGFRKGKVPAAVINQRIGREAVLEEAVNEAIPGLYDQAISEAGVVPLSRPTAEVTELIDGEKLVFEAQVDVRPEFDLPDYQGLQISVDDAEVTEGQIDEQLDALRKRFGTATPVERPAADGDLVLLDVIGRLDGEELEDFSATALSYEVGSDGMLTGADEAVRGLSKDEETTFAFTPEEGELHGADIDIQVTVRDVRELSLPEADDDFAQLASEFDTLDELRGSLRDGVERMALVDQGMAAREKALDLLLDATDIPIPESLLEEHLGEHFEDGHGDDEHREEVRAEAEKATKTRFILDKIADNEELSVGQGELTKWLMGQAPRYGMTPDQFAEALVQAGQVQSAIADVRRGKALALVLQKAVVTDASGNVVNLSALDEPTAEEQIAQLVEQAQAAAAAAGEGGDEVLDVEDSELADSSQADSSEADQR